MRWALARLYDLLDVAFVLAICVSPFVLVLILMLLESPSETIKMWRGRNRWPGDPRVTHPVNGEASTRIETED